MLYSRPLASGRSPTALKRSVMLLCLNSNSYERYSYDEAYAQWLRSANRMPGNARASASIANCAEQIENVLFNCTLICTFLILYTPLSVDVKT